MDAIWIPIQPAWGVERNPGGPMANNSIASKVYTYFTINKLKRSQFTLFYPQDITFNVRAMFRVCEMTALCIRSRISPPRAPNSSLIASSTSVDYHPKTSMMMLYCRMSYPGNCCLSSQRRGPYLMVFSSCFFSLFSVHGQLISTVRPFFFS